MKVRVKLPEFTWHDASGYHTVAHVGEVPEKHPEVAAALKAGYLVPSESPTGPTGPTGPTPKTKKEA